jgi:hypothetical protein
MPSDGKSTEITHSIGRRPKIKIISKFVGLMFHESLPRVRKENQIAQQASAGYLLSMNPLSVIRKAQRRREKIASMGERTPPPRLGSKMRLMIASKMIFLPGP